MSAYHSRFSTRFSFFWPLRFSTNPSMLVHDSAICSVPYISYMDLKGQRCSLCNIVRLIARDNIAYISSLDLKLDIALRGISCSILCSLLKSMSVLRYAALYVVHEKLFNLFWNWSTSHGLQGHPTNVFCKISVRSKYCLEFSFPLWRLKTSRFSKLI